MGGKLAQPIAGRVILQDGQSWNLAAILCNTHKKPRKAMLCEVFVLVKAIIEWP
jgi:hypothetical protein